MTTAALLRSVCDQDKVDAFNNGFWVITQEELDRFAAAVHAAALEEAAKVLDDHWFRTQAECAAAIRMLKDKK